MSSLEVVRRPGKNGKTYLQIRGTILHPDGRTERIRRAPSSENIKLARQEAAALETRLLREAIHGKPRGAKPFAEAVASWLTAKDRAVPEQERIERILAHLPAGITCGEIDQEIVNELRGSMFRWKPSEATVIRAIITPLRTVLRYGHRQKWCDAPVFEIPELPEEEPNFLLPNEMRKLVLAAAPHLKPLLIFLAGTGARMSEATYLEWANVDLAGPRVTFRGTRRDDEGKKRRGTKSGRRRVAELPPVVVEALTELAVSAPKTDGRPVGRVFRWTTQAPRRKGKTPPIVTDYAEKKGDGGQIKTAWKGARRRAGLDMRFTPHDLRHTWASWHYAIHKDLLKLQHDGRWSSVKMVERYAHLLPAGHEADIRAFLAGDRDATQQRHTA